MTIEIDDSGRTIETDILILGSGAAGCGAAIGAKEQGARVLLVDKGRLESSGCLEIKTALARFCKINHLVTKTCCFLIFTRRYWCKIQNKQRADTIDLKICLQMICASLRLKGGKNQ